MENDFQIFWDQYGLKRDRIAAQRAWSRLSGTDKQAALAGIAAYRADCEQRGIQMMYGQGYLNHRRWEDQHDETDRRERRQKDLFTEPEILAGDGMEQW